MTEGLTAVQTSRAAGSMGAVVGRLFEVLGSWAGEADRPDVAVCLATASRHMGWHADDLSDLVPESELLESVRVEQDPPAPIFGALDTIRGMPGSLERLAVCHRVLLARLATGCLTIERLTAAHADAPLARVVGFLLADIRRDRDDGELLLDRLLVDVDSVERVATAVVDAERRIVVSGGLFPTRLSG